MSARVEHIFQSETRGDTSFQEKESILSTLFGGKKYSQEQVREIWQRGIRHGIEIGLNKASIEGQRVEMWENTVSDKHREFLKKFHDLAREYDCAIQYHPKHGLMVLSTK